MRSARAVVRWLLNRPGITGGRLTTARDYVMVWSRIIDETLPVLFYLWNDGLFHPTTCPKVWRTFYVGKGATTARRG